MDAGAAAGPWIVLGAVLGIALLVAGWWLLRGLGSRAGGPPEAMPAPAPRDDLAGFLEHPPGTGPAHLPDGGWVPLAPAPPAAAPAPRADEPGDGVRPGTVLAALALAVLLVVGVAAAVAAGTRDPAPRAGAPAAAPATTAPADDAEGASARLVFEGIVLDEHAVGVTVAHPELELTTREGRAVAELRLPTANCLLGRAPQLPGDPACRAARTEVAELAAPDLRVERDGDELRLSGSFATSLRPAGGPPQPTGRVLDLVVTVHPVGDEDTGGWRPAEGELVVGEQRVATRGGDEVSSLRHAR